MSKCGLAALSGLQTVLQVYALFLTHQANTTSLLSGSLLRPVADIHIIVDGVLRKRR